MSFSLELSKVSKQLCKKIPDDILTIILEYDGRWRKDADGKWISKFHMSDEKYWMLDNMIRWNEFNSYCYPDSGRRSYTNADRIGFIFPIMRKEYNNIEYGIDGVDEYGEYKYSDDVRFMHINKVIVYDVDHTEYGTIKKSKFNIVRAFTCKLGCHLDSSDSYGSDDDEHEYGVYIDETDYHH